MLGNAMEVDQFLGGPAFALMVLHLAVVGLLYVTLGTSFRNAQTAATVVTMTLNYLLNNVITYRDQQLKGFGWLKGLATFYLVCSLGAVANVGIGSLVYARLPEWWVAGVAGAVVGSVWNYVASGWLTWTRR